MNYSREVKLADLCKLDKNLSKFFLINIVVVEVKQDWSSNQLV